MRIFITSVGTATSVNLIKGFKSMNDYVVGGDINQFGYTAGSTMVDSYYQLAKAVEDSYIDEVCSVIEKENIDILIPVNDIEIYCISKNIEKIKCKCIIPTTEVIEEVRDKYVCNSKIKQIGEISVPDSMTDNQTDDVIMRDKIGVGSKGILVLTKGQEIPPYSKDEKFLQRYISGVEYTVDILSDLNGKPVYIVPRKRLEVKSGVATKVEIENNYTLIKYVEIILAHIILPGFSNIQFIRDQQERYWFVEINCRFSGCGGATLAVCKNYLDIFKKIALEQYDGDCVNRSVKWNTVVTRYYEECVYENGIY